MEEKAEQALEPIAANVAYSYINYASGVLATLCLVPLFTRFLGNRLYGEFVVIATLATNLSLANIGLDQALTNQIAYERCTPGEAEIEKLISTAYLAYSVIALIVIVVLAAGSSWFCRVFVSESDKAAPLAFFALGALTMVSLPFRTYGSLLRGLGHVFEEQRIAALFMVARLAATAIVLLAGFKLLAIVVVQGLAICGAAVGAFWRSRILYTHTTKISLFSVQVLRSLAAPSLAFAVLRVAGIVGFGIDTLVIGQALGPEQVTRYSVAFSLVVVCGTTVFSTLDLAILPTVSAFHARRNMVLLKRYLSLMGRLAALYVGTSGIGLWIAGPWFLRLWAGVGVFPGPLTFALLIGLLVIQVLIQPFWTLLVASSQHYGVAAMHTFESLLNLLLSIWWVRRFGLPGVIAGTVVARLVTTGWYIPIVASRKIDVHLIRAALSMILPMLLSAAASCAFLWCVAVTPGARTVPLVALLGALIFATTFIMIAFSREERLAAIQYIRRPFPWTVETVK